MSTPEVKPVTLSYQLSDWTLWRVTVPLQVCAQGLHAGDQAAVADPQPPPGDLVQGSRGFMLRAFAVSQSLPPLQRIKGYLRYVPLQYQHCYIELSGTFDDYKQKFSGKTRSTLTRKVRKFTEHCAGTLKWTCYRTLQELNDFFPLARQVSRKTYQERLLDAGLPEDDAFIAAAQAQAALDGVRAYLLFDGDRPVAYLYCPAQADVLIYAYLGYDPEYQKHSPGTVLQWLAFEHIFAEGRFRFFDFTEGESEHKRLFATHQRQCANVMFVRDDWRGRLVIYSHRAFSAASSGIGRTLDRWGLKARLRRLLRAGA